MKLTSKIGSPYAAQSNQATQSSLSGLSGIRASRSVRMERSVSTIFGSLSRLSCAVYMASGSK